MSKQVAFITQDETDSVVADTVLTPVHLGDWWRKAYYILQYLLLWQMITLLEKKIDVKAKVHAASVINHVAVHSVIF